MRPAAIPEPMLARSGPLPVGAGWRFEVKWDGFRALVSTERELRARSRNGWAMTRLLPELEPMPRGLLLDGELVAWGDSGLPDFDRLCARLLHRVREVAVTFMVFDLLRVDAHSLLETPYERRRRLLEELDVNGAAWFTPDVFDDGEALWQVVCDRGLEGVVAKRLSSLYRPGHRGGGWVKRKSPTWPRRNRELETLRRKLSVLAR